MTTTTDNQPYLQWHFGNCPECHRCSGFRNVGPVSVCGPDNWFHCETHKVRWYASSGYFQDFPSLTEEETEIFFREYRELTRDLHGKDEVWFAEDHLDELPPEEAERVAAYRDEMVMSIDTWPAAQG